MNGLNIALEDFDRMDLDTKITIIYKNMLEIKRQDRDYRFNKKVTYTWLGLITIFVGVKKYLGF